MQAAKQHGDRGACKQKRASARALSLINALKRDYAQASPIKNLASEATLAKSPIKQSVVARCLGKRGHAF